jgi:integrase
MAVLQFVGQRLIVNYLYDNHGHPYFQIRVPMDLRDRFNQRSKISLRLTPEDGPPTIQVQRLAKNYKALFKAMRNDPSLTTQDEKVAALAMLQSHQLMVGDGNIRLENWSGEDGFDDQPHLDGFIDQLIETSRERPLNRTEQLAYKALKGPLPVSLSEIVGVYFENHPRGQDKVYRKKVNEYWAKLLSFVGDIAVATLTRDQAKAFILNRLGTGVRRSTVQKEVNILKAVLAKGIRELELTAKNPFEQIQVPLISGSESEKRVGFTLEEHRLLIKGAIQSGDDIRMIALTCAFTGCRIGEAVGLRLEDLRLDADTPHLRIEPYGQRSLKTGNSQRDVPVLEPLRAALMRYQKASNGEERNGALFPRYNSMIRPPNASGATASVNKWIRSLGLTKTSHCFRHSIISMLRETGIPLDLREEITGHQGQRISDNYGEQVSIKRKYAVLKSALAALVLS